MHAHARTCICRNTHMHMQKHTHAYAETHTHTHMQTCAQERVAPRAYPQPQALRSCSTDDRQHTRETTATTGLEYTPAAPSQLHRARTHSTATWTAETERTACCPTRPSRPTSPPRPTCGARREGDVGAVCSTHTHITRDNVQGTPKGSTLGALFTTHSNGNLQFATSLHLCVGCEQSTA